MKKVIKWVAVAGALYIARKLYNWAKGNH